MKICAAWLLDALARLARCLVALRWPGAGTLLFGGTYLLESAVDLCAVAPVPVRAGCAGRGDCAWRWRARRGDDAMTLWRLPRSLVMLSLLPSLVAMTLTTVMATSELRRSLRTPCRCFLERLDQFLN
jgi:hypothetical protein